MSRIMDAMTDEEVRMLLVGMLGLFNALVAEDGLVETEDSPEEGDEGDAGEDAGEPEEEPEPEAAPEPKKVTRKGKGEEERDEDADEVEEWARWRDEGMTVAAIALKARRPYKAVRAALQARDDAMGDAELAADMAEDAE